MNELWRNRKTKKLVIVPAGAQALGPEAHAMSFQFPSHAFWINLNNYEKVLGPEAKELWGDKR